MTSVFPFIPMKIFTVFFTENFYSIYTKYLEEISHYIRTFGNYEQGLAGKG